MTILAAEAPVHVAVGMGAMAVSRTDGQVLAAYGVGSCVIICARDALTRVSGMAHVVQPRGPAADADGAWFADAAVPSLLGRLESAGAVTRRLVFWLAGGASVLHPVTKSGQPTLGDLNARAVQQALAARRLVVAGVDVGGTHGRTVLLDVASGAVLVKTLGRGEVIL